MTYFVAPLIDSELLIHVILSFTAAISFTVLCQRLGVLQFAFVLLLFTDFLASFSSLIPLFILFVHTSRELYPRQPLSVGLLAPHVSTLLTDSLACMCRSLIRVNLIILSKPQYYGNMTL